PSARGRGPPPTPLPSVFPGVRCATGVSGHMVSCRGLPATTAMPSETLLRHLPDVQMMARS
ncbi:MAG: hypothetical protein ABF689_14880, partial [Gluconobacter cerinus]|uniref:hypothetical protein n=1 Tax=Gluconobacter cerinus TaxID=38307 RepID=UPI0039E78DEF